MAMFGIGQCREVGIIKTYEKDMLVDCPTPNDRDLALRFVLEKATELGLTPVNQL